MDVNAVMDGIGAALDDIAGLRVYGYAVENPAIPAAVVALPSSLEYDYSMARGTDRCVIPIHVLVGKVSDRVARDKLGPYLAGSGDSSIKAAVEDDPTLGGAAHTVRVTRAGVSVMTVTAIDYLAASFDVDVVA